MNQNRDNLIKALKKALEAARRRGSSDLVYLHLYQDRRAQYGLSDTDMGTTEKEVAEIERDCQVADLKQLLHLARESGGSGIILLRTHEDHLKIYNLSHADAGTTEEEIAQLREKLTRLHKESTVTPTCPPLGSFLFLKMPEGLSPLTKWDISCSFCNGSFHKNRFSKGEIAWIALLKPNHHKPGSPIQLNDERVFGKRLPVLHILVCI